MASINSARTSILHNCLYVLLVSSVIVVNSITEDISAPSEYEALGRCERRCNGRSFGYDSVACACNAEYCDTAPYEPPTGLRRGQVLKVVSTRDGRRMEANLGRLRAFDDVATVTLRVGSPRSFRQHIIGFGGAVTDSTAALLRALSPATRRRLLEQFFGPTGARYSLVRVPIGGTDFSTRNYTYDDGPPDPLLKRFTLALEDLRDKIPVLHEVRMLAGAHLRLFAAPWSAPAWMVASEDDGFNHLDPQYNQAWADYFVKFLDSYAKEGVRFWGISAQNEPSDGYIVNYDINRLGWSPERMRDWLRDFLGPTLQKRGYKHLKLMIHDDQRPLLPDWAIRTLNDSITDSYVSGIAVHWYLDFDDDPTVLSETHKLFANKFLLYTEASDGPILSGGPAVQLGNWSRAENYAKDIIDATNNWVSGWVDWNMVLDTDGGPTWRNNNLDATVIVNVTADEFFKQPTFYALAHFSRFVPRGSFNVPISLQSEGQLRNFFATAFLTPQRRYVVVLLNKDSTTHQLSVLLEDSGNLSYKHTVPEHSITTLIIRPNLFHR